jgi:hypothetical protein
MSSRYVQSACLYVYLAFIVHPPPVRGRESEASHFREPMPVIERYNQ